VLAEAPAEFTVPASEPVAAIIKHNAIAEARVTTVA
jgi:hypothetical protein